MNKNRKIKLRRLSVIVLALILAISATACGVKSTEEPSVSTTAAEETTKKETETTKASGTKKKTTATTATTAAEAETTLICIDGENIPENIDKSVLYYDESGNAYVDANKLVEYAKKNNESVEFTDKSGNKITVSKKGDISSDTGKTETKTVNASGETTEETSQKSVEQVTEEIKVQDETAATAASETEDIYEDYGASEQNTGKSSDSSYENSDSYSDNTSQDNSAKKTVWSENEGVWDSSVNAYVFFYPLTFNVCTDEETALSSICSATRDGHHEWQDVGSTRTSRTGCFCTGYCTMQCAFCEMSYQDYWEAYDPYTCVVYYANNGFIKDPANSSYSPYITSVTGGTCQDHITHYTLTCPGCGESATIDVDEGGDYEHTNEVEIYIAYYDDHDVEGLSEEEFYANYDHAEGVIGYGYEHYCYDCGFEAAVATLY